MKRNNKAVRYLSIMIMILLLPFSGCADNAPAAEATPTLRRSVKESVPDITDTKDGMRKRYNDITVNFNVNESVILEGFMNLYNCEVVKTDDSEYPYRMWIFGESTKESQYVGYDSIYHARGKSLDTWEVYCGDKGWDTTMDPKLWEPVMVHASKSYDSIHNGDPSVVYKDGLFYMAFSSVGFDEREGTTYIINCVMGAVSKDGISWQKTEAPILIWEKEYEEGWVAGTPTPPGTGGYHRPSLLWDEEEDKWKLWFDYYLPGTFLSMGYAVNNGEFSDPTHWQLMHAENDPQLKDWPNPEVVKINGKYYTFSDVPNFGVKYGAQNDRQIVMAVSDNGWDWHVAGRILPESSRSEYKYASHLPQTYTETIDGKEYLYIFYSLVAYETLPKYTAANFMYIPVEELENLVKDI